MSDAHAEWHRNAGVPMGQPGCPQDACHAEDYADLDAMREDEAADPDWHGWDLPADEPPF